MVPDSVHELARNNGSHHAIKSILAIYKDSLSSKQLANRLLSVQHVAYTSTLGLVDHYQVKFPQPDENITYPLYNTEFDIALVTKTEPIIFVQCTIINENDQDQTMTVIGQPLDCVYDELQHLWWERHKHLHIKQIVKKSRRSRFAAFALDRTNR